MKDKCVRTICGLNWMYDIIALKVEHNEHSFFPRYKTMKPNKFPSGWDEKRVQNVITYYDQQTEDESVAEAETALENKHSTLMAIPTELVPAVLELIDKHVAKAQS